MSALDLPDPGTRLAFQWRKWDGSPHWRHDCIYLGRDEWGDWFGQPDGSRSHRPGRDFLTEWTNVTLMASTGDFAFTRHVPGHRTRTYIDLAWDLRWVDGVPTGIDMDLDVVDRPAGEGVFIDDRDEWDEHRVRYGYPAQVVAHLEALANDLRDRVAGDIPPFDESVAPGWFARLDELTAPGPA